jgi:hypothetical protein
VQAGHLKAELRSGRDQYWVDADALEEYIARQAAVAAALAKIDRR